MKKVGRILFCFVPFLLAFSIQMMLSVPFTGISFAYVICSSSDTADFRQIMENFMTILQGSTFTTLLSATYGVAALFVFAFWYQKKFHGLDLPGLTHYFNPRIIIAIVCLAVGLQYVVNYVVNFTAFLFPSWLDIYENIMNTIDFAHVTPVLALYSVVIAPISEELIFRGVTLNYAKRLMPFWVANLLQAVLFGVFHMNPLQGVYACFIGLFLGYVCYKGGSIFLSMLLHAVFNLWGTFAPENFMYHSNQPFFFVFWLVFGCLFLTIGVILYKKGLLIRNQKIQN